MELLDRMMKRVKNWRTNVSKDSTMWPDEYFRTMDELTLFNWIKINDGDTTFIRKNKSKGTAQMDEYWFNKIYDEYIVEFGLSELHKKMLVAMKKRAMLECDFIITGEQFKITEIEVQIAKIDSMLRNNGSGMSIEQTLIHMSKWMGAWLNSKTISVRDYFNLMNEFRRSNKPQKK